MRVRLTTLLPAVLLAVPGVCQGTGVAIGVLSEAMPGRPDYGSPVVAALTGVSGEVQEIGWEQLDGIDPAQFPLLVITDPGHMPGRALRSLDSYLAARGRLLVVGNERMVGMRYVKTEAGWVTLQAALGAIRPTYLVTAGDPLLDGWAHSSGPAPAREVTRSATAAPDGSAGVDVSIIGLEGWDTYRVPIPADAFAADRSVVTFWARGWGETDQLIVECQEEDGSRWIAPVPLESKWRQYALTPSDFGYWPDSPATGRGGTGDRVRLEAVRMLSVGIATGHGSAGILPGDHRYAIAGLGTAPSPLSEDDSYDTSLECLLPWYKTYPIDEVEGIRSTEIGRSRRLPESLPPPDASGLCAIGRPRGLGVEGPSGPGRLVCLAEAVSRSGEWRGNLAYVWHEATGARAGARWGAVGLPPCAEAAPLIRAVAHALLSRASLLRAGATRWSSFDDEQPAALAAEVSAGGDAVAGVTVRFEVVSETGTPLVEQTVHLDPVPPGHTVLVEGGPLPHLDPGFYTVRTTLRVSGRVEDLISQSISVHPSEPEPASRVALSEDGTGFALDGKPFIVHGINYWPLYACGADPTMYWSHWLSPNQYDPEAIERDLLLLERLGGNVVSIQYLGEGMSRPLVDFLARCRRHGIYVNAYLSCTHPLGFEPESARRMLTLPRLARNAAVFAYDLAWEPHFGRETARAAQDPAWRQWIEDNYGSAQALEAAMGGPLPRDAEGRVTGPSDALLVSTDPTDAERVLVAAYRHFVDDLVSYGYGRVTGFIRHELGDPALLGARTGYGGTGQPGIVPAMPYDLLSGAAHLDCVQPEGYGLDGEWVNFRYGGLTTQYGRWAGNGKPVWWAEYGRSVFSGLPEPTDEMIELQRRLYENTYRMVIESRADGSAGWWWPGGYRVDERSDYGIISPACTPRPAALEMMRFARDMEERGPVLEPTLWIEFDRDLYPMGYAGVWLQHREQYAEAIAEGRWVGLRTEATGTTTRDFPRVSIGNVPWTPGLPFKHLKGEVHRPTLLRPGTAPVYLDTVEPPVAPGAYTLELVIVNTSEVTWLPGDMHVSVAFGGDRHETAIDETLPRYGRTTVAVPVRVLEGGTELEARLSFEGRPFGVPLRLRMDG